MILGHSTTRLKNNVALIVLRVSVVILFLIFLRIGNLSAQSIPSPLRWGADSEGGAPYIFQDPTNPSRVIGYEVDLMEALCKELGVQSEFVQNQWDGLIEGLQRNNYDLVINGLEISPDRAAVIAFSDPCYLT